MSNPLIMVVGLLLVLMIVLTVIRMVMPQFSAGLGVNAHVGSIKGSVNLEAFEAPFNMEESDIESFQNNDIPSFVIFKAEWCGHCQRVMPEIQKLQQEKPDGVQIVVIDSDKSPDLIKEHGIKGFPTIRMYPQGLSNKSTYEDFEGERSLDGFKTFLQRLMKN